MSHSPTRTLDGLGQFIRFTTRDPAELLGLTFYSGQPRNFLSGVARAAGNLVMGTGIGVGAGCVVATRGVQRRNVMAVLVYSVLTTMSCFGLGGVMALQQLCRGTWGSLEYLRRFIFGDSLWDETMGRWRQVNLQEELSSIPQTDADLEEKARAAYAAAEADRTDIEDEPGVPVEREREKSFYKLLGVEHSATQAEISKAYRVKALLMHPDKCGDTPEARTNFQRLSEAYTTLSNPATREAYDHNGIVDSSDGTVASPATTMADAVRMPFTEPLIGPLAVSLLLTPFHFYSHQLRTEAQRRRELRVAQQLCHFLDHPTGLEQARMVVQDAMAAVCGPLLLSLVAQEYRSVARQFHLVHLMREIDQIYSSVSRASHVCQGYWRLFRQARAPPVSDADATESFAASLAAVSESNTRRTVRQAANMALKDTSVSTAVRQQRAERLKQLAGIIEEVLQQRS
eukprot:gene9458-6640_t